MTDANIALVQSLYDAFGRGDIATVIAGLTPDIDWQSVGRAADYPAFGLRKGQQAVQEFFKIVADNEDFTEFSPQEFYSADDKVFVIGRYALTVKKTGKPVATEWVHVFTVKNGKVSRFREHTDTAQFAAAYRG